jgi:electron transfer flavoprotein alpha/beta subunit
LPIEKLIAVSPAVKSKLASQLRIKAQTKVADVKLAGRDVVNRILEEKEERTETPSPLCPSINAHGGINETRWFNRFIRIRCGWIT